MEDAYGTLLVRALRGQLTELPDGVNLDRLIWRASEHGLAGPVANALAGVAAPGTPLGRVLEKLDALVRVQEATARVQLRAAAEISSALRDRDVPAAFFKGVAMALTVYPEAGVRAFGDIDVLVAPRDLPRAREALAATGFVPDPAVPATAMSENYRLPGRGLLSPAVDLHWDLAERDGFLASVRIPVAEILSRAREVRGIPVPSEGDSLLLSAVNLIRSRLDRVVLLVDAAGLASADVRWPEVLQRAAAWNARTALWLELELASRLFRARVPPEALRELAPARWKKGLIEVVLGSATLWARRKERHRFLAYGLPLLCADSPAGVAAGLWAGARKAASRIGRTGGGSGLAVLPGA